MKKLSLIIIIAIASFINANAQWEKLPGPYGGAFNSIAVAKGKIWAKSGTNYSKGGSVFTSPTENIYWTQQEDCPLPPINSVYSYGNDLYACTAEGVYLSTDVGVNWTHVYDNLPTENVESIIFGDNYIGVVGNYNYAYISFDAGESWGNLKYNGRKLRAYGLAASITGDTVLVGGPSHGLNVSYDKGITWNSHLVSPTFNENDPRISQVYIHNNVYYAYSVDRIYYSLDFGNSWEKSASKYYLKKLVFMGDLIIGQGDTRGIYIFKIKDGKLTEHINPVDLGMNNDLVADNNTIYVSTYSGFYLSKDSGTSWTKYNQGANYTYTNKIISHNDGLLASGWATGLFFSSDEGMNWSEQPFDQSITTFRVLKSKSGIIYGIPEFQNILLLSFDGGENWHGYQNELTNLLAQSVLPLDDRSLAGTNKGIYISYDTCKTWRLADSALTQYSFTCIANTPKTVIAGSPKGLFISEDAGESWKKIDYKFEDANMRGIEADDSVVVAYNTDGYLYVSSDYGHSWKTINQPFGNVPAVAVKGKYIFASGNRYEIFLSTNLGASWSSVGGKAFAYSAYVFDLLIKDDYIYTAGSNGVHRASLSDFGIHNGVYDRENERLDIAYSIYPNPAADFIVIAGTDGPYTISIYNSFGEKVHSAENVDRVNISSLPQGAYFVGISANGKSAFTKFVKIK
ncbi:MAG: T9SS type A sorting domain-containing protein [Chloroflexota bacterium]